MYNSQRPNLDELPSSVQLLRSTVIALIVAGVLLVTVVMPAEYAIDPTGVGRLLGITQMGELKATLAEESTTEAASAKQPSAVAAAQPVPAPDASALQPALAAAPLSQAEAVAMQQHEVNLTLKPNQATEIKLEMKEGAKVNFHWSANGGLLNYDTHGDPYQAPQGFYHGYGKGKQTPQQQGVLVAAFDGKHGWFWRNRTDQTVKLTLRTEGDYITIEQVL
jgi:hypothetical protein